MAASKQDFSDDQPRVPAGESGGGQFASAGGGGGGGSSKSSGSGERRTTARVKEWAAQAVAGGPGKLPLSERAKNWLSKASENVRSFFTDKDARKEAFKTIAEKIRNAPRELKDKVIEKVRENVKDAKLAGAGINANLHGKRMTAEQKTATKKVALKIGIAVAAQVIAGGLPVHFIGTEIGRHVAEQLGHHLAEKALERVASVTTGLELDAGDELEVLVTKLLSAMADEAEDLASSDDISELLERMAGGDDGDTTDAREDTVEQVFRLDFASGSVSERRRTAQGGLIAKANFTRTGVFDYRMSDGSIRRELRPPEEVFNADSLASYAGAPATVDHPGRVTPDNWQQVTRGHVPGAGVRSGDFVSGEVHLQDAAAISDAEAGKLKEISCGYTCDIDPTPGDFRGDSFDAIQRNIRINHVALGPEGWGRMGKETCLRLDSNDAVSGDSYVRDTMPMTAEEKAALEKAQTEAREAQAALTTLRSDGAAVTAEVTRLRAENEMLRLQATREKQDGTAKETQSKADANFREAVREMVGLEADARSVFATVDDPQGKKWTSDGRDADGIRREVVAFLEPKMPLRYDSAGRPVASGGELLSGPALRSVYEIAMGRKHETDKARADALEAAAGQRRVDGDAAYGTDGDPPPDAAKARQGMVDKIQNSWKTSGSNRKPGVKTTSN